MNKVTAESCERGSAVTLFGPGDYCALTLDYNLVHLNMQTVYHRQMLRKERI